MTSSPSTIFTSARWVDLALRLSLAIAFLAAVADRFGWCGPPGSANVAWGAWRPFVEYTGTLLPFLPATLVEFSAIAATALEIVFGLWLLSGWQVRIAAYGSAVLLLIFGLTMVVALGWKAPLNYSVFTAAAAAWALAVWHPPCARESPAV